MTFYHSPKCRKSPLFPHCDCGADKAAARLEQLEDERVAIQSLIAGAETFVIGSTGAPFTPKMVLASDLEDVLAGRMR